MSENKVRLEISKQELTPELVEAIHQRLLQKLATKANEPLREGLHLKSGFLKTVILKVVSPGLIEINGGNKIFHLHS